MLALDQERLPVFAQDQIDAAVKIAKVNRAKWLRDLAVKEARRILSRTTAKKGGK